MAVEQRQPVLDTGIAAASGHRLVKRVVALARAEQLHIALAELLHRPLARRQLADGQQRNLLARGLGALRDGIELPDGFERVAEEVEAGRARMARREQVDDAAAHRIFAGLHHGAGAVEAGRLKPGDNLLHLQPGAGGDANGGFLDGGQRRHALQRRVDGGEHNDRGLAALGMGKLRKGCDAAGFDVAIGRNAVVGHAVPGREAQDAGAGREELKLGADGRKPLIVAGDVQHRLLELGIGRQPARDGGKQEGVVALGHASGNDSALAAREPVQRRGCARRRFRLIGDAVFDCHARLLPTSQ